MLSHQRQTHTLFFSFLILTRKESFRRWLNRNEATVELIYRDCETLIWDLNTYFRLQSVPKNIMYVL